jgi:hypothetical protein
VRPRRLGKPDISCHVPTRATGDLFEQAEGSACATRDQLEAIRQWVKDQRLEGVERGRSPLKSRKPTTRVH